MFGLFRRKKKVALPAQLPVYPLPHHLARWLTETDYNQIVRLAIEHLSLKGAIDLIDEQGVIHVWFTGQPASTRFYLDNLLRKCKATTPAHWEAVVAGHVRMLPLNSAAITYIYKDLDFAAPLLKVQVKPVGFAQDILHDCVYRQDFPQTNTFLVIDFEEALHYVRRSDMGEWEVSDTYLFEVALDNIAQERPDITAHQLDGELPLYTLFHTDFAASAGVQLARNIGEAIGLFGAIVNIPAKGSVFVHPLETDTVMAYILASRPMIQGFYEEEVYTINQEYYWYYNGQYHLFPIRVEGNNAYLSYPARLRQLLHGPSE